MFSAIAMDLPPHRQQDIQKWLTNQCADEVRKHIEAKVVTLGNEAIREAIESADYPKKAEISKAKLEEAQKWRSLLMLWNELTAKNYVFTAIST